MRVNSFERMKHGKGLCFAVQLLIFPHLQVSFVITLNSIILKCVLSFQLIILNPQLVLIGALSSFNSLNLADNDARQTLPGRKKLQRPNERFPQRKTKIRFKDIQPHRCESMMCYIEFVAVCRILMISFGSSFNNYQQAPTSELLESMSAAGTSCCSCKH